MPIFVHSLKVGDTNVNGDVKFTGAIFAINEQTIDFGTVNKTLVLTSTDDIQSALDEVAAAGGGTIYLKAGTYVVTSSLTITSDVHLIGESAGNTTVVFVVPGTNLSMTGSNIYTTGTISSIASGVIVTGSGTTWTADMIGRSIFISNRWYEIANVTGSTELILATGYADGATYSGTYRIASIVDVIEITDITFTGSTTTAIVGTDVSNITLQDLTIASNNKGLSLTNSMNTDIQRVILVSSTSNGYELTNSSFFNAQDFACISNGGHGAVWNNVKTSRVIYSASDANTNDGYNLTDVTNSVFIVEASGNGGQGFEFVSGCTYNFMPLAIASGNGSDGIKLTATSIGNTISSANLQGNNGYGINIAAASCTANIIIFPTYAGNVSGTLNDSGVGTIIAAAQSTKTGTFTTVDGKTVTYTNGIITNVV